MNLLARHHILIGVHTDWPITKVKRSLLAVLIAYGMAIAQTAMLELNLWI